MTLERLILPDITTKRLFLRELRRSDAHDLFEYAMSPKVGPSAGWKPHDTIDETYHFIEYAIKKKDYGQPGVFAIILQATGKMIGTIEIHSYRQYKGEIGFVLNPEYWNQGLMTEAAKAVVIYAMEILKLQRLAYCHFPENIASKRVCEKLGFTFEGVLRDKFLMYDGSLKDDVTYSILLSEYKNGKIEWVNAFKNDVFID